MQETENVGVWAWDYGIVVPGQPFSMLRGDGFDKVFLEKRICVVSLKCLLTM